MVANVLAIILIVRECNGSLINIQLTESNARLLVIERVAVSSIPMEISIFLKKTLSQELREHQHS